MSPRFSAAGRLAEVWEKENGNGEFGIVRIANDDNDVALALAGNKEVA